MPKQSFHKSYLKGMNTYTAHSVNVTWNLHTRFDSSDIEWEGLLEPEVKLALMVACSNFANKLSLAISVLVGKPDRAVAKWWYRKRSSRKRRSRHEAPRNSKTKHSKSKTKHLGQKTKHPETRKRSTRSRKRSTLGRKRSTPQLENEAP